MILGQCGGLGVADKEVLEQRNGTGGAVVQQEVAKVEVAVGSAHFDKSMMSAYRPRSSSQM